MNLGQLVKYGAAAGGYAIRKRAPKVDGRLPTLGELEETIARVQADKPKVEVPVIEQTETSQQPDVATACVPCSIGHWSTCSGLLNEAMRFKEEGMSTEVVDRVNMCLDELNALERVDLTPEKLAESPPWERKIAETALHQSRKIRHALEQVQDVVELEKIAVETDTYRTQLGREWFQQRMENLNPEDREKVKAKAKEIIEERIAATE